MPIISSLKCVKSVLTTNMFIHLVLWFDVFFTTEKVSAAAIQLQAHICHRLARHHPRQNERTDYK